jgi:DNA-binding NarL/FixJ family response regulator
MKQGLVVVADTHLTMLQGLHALLESLFESTVMVADELSLLETVSQCQPEMIVVDLSFPVTIEDNVISLLKKHSPKTPLIAVSVHDEVSVARSVLEQSAMAYVLKRTGVLDLVDAVEAVRQGKTHVSPSIRLPPANPRRDSSEVANHDSPSG